jgi:Gpi18-like mannosyltransferase
MVPLYYVPFYLLGNIRFGNIFADLLIMIAAYWIAKSINRGIAIFASLTFAILPASVWLTSVTSTNIMIGAAFLMLSFAALVQNKYSVAAVFFGIGIATNQLVALMLPLFGYYYWGQQKFSRFLLGLAVSVTIILPFLLASPTNFLYDTVEYQFVRPL